MPASLHPLVVALAILAAAAPAAAQDVSIHAGDAAPEWRVAPSGASFAPLYGDPADARPFAFLMKMPANWTMQPHVHDTAEHLTVLAGTLSMTFAPDGEWTDLAPGSVIAIPAGVPMWARTKDAETIIQVYGTGPFHTTPADTASLVVKARTFRELVRNEEYVAAEAMMTAGPRRWFAPREGEGRPWSIRPGTGPWAAWDDHFGSRSELLEWREEPGAAVALVRETNDYFALLDRGWVTNELTYLFDDVGRISGLVIGTAGERPPGRTEAFLAWARANEPDELATLMPDGEIDPSGDHPERFRRLLERWRAAAGLPPIR